MRALATWVTERRLVVVLLLALATGIGAAVAPFQHGWWHLDLGEQVEKVPVDAIPDIGENQQIVFTAWPGRSPQDVEDQITYPLTAALLGTPGVRTIRSASMFGFSSVNVIFEDDVAFYWSRSRLLEKLAALPAGTLPEGVRPQLGPDATALGQVYWYTLEGRDAQGRPAPGWSLEELRSIQDFYVRPGLGAAAGVSEVASVGGMVRELQIDLDPDAMRANGITLGEVVGAVQRSNRDVGARTIEVNAVEYVLRGVGFLRDLDDVRGIVLRERDGAPLRIQDVARVHDGPAPRRGLLDKGGAEAVGGVVVARFGGNPMATIAAVRAKIAEIEPGLPHKTLADGRESYVRIVPFYDRSGLIGETIDTLDEALTSELLITAIVVLVMLLHLRASLLIALTLPAGVLLAFLGMRSFGVDANVVALSGIAIAIGTMVDMGIVVTENIVGHLERAPDRPRPALVREALLEVGPAVGTSVATTVLSFLPVFALQAAEGKLFRPLAFTKTFALLGALLLALSLLPALATLAFPRLPARWTARLPDHPALPWLRKALLLALAAWAAALLAERWMPLGRGEPMADNVAFTFVCVFGLLAVFWAFARVYPALLGWVLARKAAFLVLPTLLVALGASAWLGAERVFGWLPEATRAGLVERFPGLGSEFMPSLDEGSFLWMPSTMPHAGISAASSIIAQMDAAIAAIPEVQSAVGKLGRAESALDPAPLSMIETIVTLKPEFSELPDGTRRRNWRPEIRRQADIWAEIARVAAVPGATGAPELQPIAGRIVMLATGMRAPMGLELRGPDLETLGRFAVAVEALVKQVPEVKAEAVLADRVVGKPYLEIHVDRDAIARYGARVEDVHRVIEIAIGGMPLTTTVQGRERYAVRARYPRELRDNFDAIGAIVVPTPSGAQVPLRQLAKLEFRRGPQVIKSTDTFLTAYVVWDGRPGHDETHVVAAVERALQSAIDAGRLIVPAGVSWRFAGNYQSKLRADARLRLLIPIALVLIFVLLYLQFGRVSTSLMVFSGVAVALAGGMLAVWAYGQPGFLQAEVFGHDLRHVFGIHPVHLSVAVWVGFIALAGIATDDGVVMASWLEQRFAAAPPTDVAGVRAAVVEAGMRRIRPCLMTTATTLLALLPVLTSQGRGSDIMVPMAIPAFGGMAFELLTLFVVPVLYSGWAEFRVRRAPVDEVTTAEP